MTGPRLAAALTVSALVLGGCSEASAVKVAREEVGDPKARVEAVRSHWTPQYQKVVCGRIQVGGEYRRFVSLLTSDGVATGAIVEGPEQGAKVAFEEVTWRPMCLG